MRAALLSPLVPPVLVCVGIFSYTMLDILAGDAGMGSRRAVAHPVPWTQVCLTRRA